MDPQTLADRTRARCAREHHGATDYCSRCVQAEMMEAPVEENPDLCRGDAEEIVSEWFLSDPQADH